ncbi:hypothetical protein bas59_0127 [Escherichia phage EduardKellenberger]|uniref:Uncharacterized protein n=2 Tax=Vequintavirus TaxID=1914852 RepID=A0A4Y5TXP3_9CAUD|nr:hypothetical protein ECP32DNA_00154 [Escherichia phage vB_EcoM-ECP32]QXV77821.1 hypothetical protein bas59_0127 [Escherichia phage EduardKellenberger]
MATRKIKVVCIESTGSAFVVGQKYNAVLMGTDWKVKGLDGYEYGTTRGLRGRIGYVSFDNKEKFVFDIVVSK